MKKRIFSFLLAAMAIVVLNSCGAEKAPELGSIPTANVITLNGSSIEVSGSGMKAEGNTVTISAPGSYTVKGSLDNGQIIVDVAEEAVETELVLDNVSISNMSGPAIHVETGKDLKLKFKGENIIVSGSKDAAAAEASGAAIYAEDDMSIKGEDNAVLKVFGYINNGIACKNDIDIKGGKIEITAVNNGLRGADSVEVKGGELVISSGNDGIKSTSTDKEGKGYINIKGGIVTVNAKGDGISAATELNISGGTISLNSEKNGVETISDVNISGGELYISSLSDGIQAGEANSGMGNINISGGNVLVDAAKQGMKPRAQMNVSGGFVLALGGKEKTIEGQGFEQFSQTGFKGDEASVSEGNSVVCKLKSTYSFKDILVGGAEKPYTVTVGNTSIIVD